MCHCGTCRRCRRRVWARHYRAKCREDKIERERESRWKAELVDIEKYGALYEDLERLRMPCSTKVFIEYLEQYHSLADGEVKELKQYARQAMDKMFPGDSQRWDEEYEHRHKHR